MNRKYNIFLLIPIITFYILLFIQSERLAKGFEPINCFFMVVAVGVLFIIMKTVLDSCIDRSLRNSSQNWKSRSLLRTMYVGAVTAGILLMGTSYIVIMRKNGFGKIIDNKIILIFCSIIIICTIILSYIYYYREERNADIDSHKMRNE